MRDAVFAGESAGKMGFFLPYPDYVDARNLLANVAGTAGTTVTIKAGSFIKYRAYS